MGQRCSTIQSYNEVTFAGLLSMSLKNSLENSFFEKKTGLAHNCCSNSLFPSVLSLIIINHSYEKNRIKKRFRKV